jgi:hypothetical protein
MRHFQGSTFVRAFLVLALGIGLIGPGYSVRAEGWTLPDSRLGVRTAPLLLLTRPDVQTDLRLDQAQILGAQNSITELTRRAQALRGKTGPGVIAERRAIDEAQLDWLGKFLTGNQLERLRQIELQWEGPAAMLSRPTVAEYLKLTPEQRQTLARIITQRHSLTGKGRSELAAEQSFQQQTRAVLTPTQNELWSNLLGDPLRFASTPSTSPGRDEKIQQAGHSQPIR